MMKSVLQTLREIIYPSSCPGCGRKTEKIQYCNNCLPVIAKREADVSSYRFKHLDGVVYLCSYSGVVKKTLREIKYHERPGRAKALSNLLPPVNELFTEEYFNVVVPVPLHRKRYNERGYNQTELIFRVWAKNNGIPWVDLLSRTKGTAPQWQLLQQARRDNVRGVFYVGQPTVVQGAKVLLVDDIFTSGATLEECAKTLKRSGASVVRALTLAHGR